MNHDHPNWIQARAKCNVETWLAAIVELMREDVRRMQHQIKCANASAPIDDKRTFTITTNGDKPPVTVVGLKGRDQPKVEIHKNYDHDDRIRVVQMSAYHGKPASTFDVVIAWNSGADKCSLTIDGDSVEAWEVSKRALEPLFFGG